MSRIDDVREAIEVVTTIVSGVQEIKYGGFKPANEVESAVQPVVDISLTDEFIAQKIFETWQSIEVTNRNANKGSGGGGSGSSSTFSPEAVLGFIKERGYGYVDGMAKYFKKTEDEVFNAVVQLVAQKKIYQNKDKGYYKISTWSK